jgi:hypothetical protein
MPADEGLGEPHVIDELGDGRGALGQALDDTQAVDVGQSLVEAAQRAQVIGLVDDRGDRRADVGGRGGQGVRLRLSIELYIKRR